jgi:hypothetical protein
MHPHELLLTADFLGCEKTALFQVPPVSLKTANTTPADSDCLADHYHWLTLNEQQVSNLLTTGLLNQGYVDYGNESLWWNCRDAVRHCVRRVNTDSKEFKELYAVAVRLTKLRLAPKCVSHWNRLFTAYCTCIWQPLQLHASEWRALTIAKITANSGNNATASG